MFFILHRTFCDAFCMRMKEEIFIECVLKMAFGNSSATFMGAGCEKSNLMRSTVKQFNLEHERTVGFKGTSRTSAPAMTRCDMASS